MIPDCPIISLGARAAFILTPEGEVLSLAHKEVTGFLEREGHTGAIVCFAPYFKEKTGVVMHGLLDVMELFAFVHPGRFATPSVYGVCDALELSRPTDKEDEPLSLLECVQALLSDLKNDPYRAKADPLKISAVMGAQGKGWAWTPYIFEAFGYQYNDTASVQTKGALDVWQALPEWAENPPPPPASHYAVTEDEAQEHLKKMLGFDSEERGEQITYTRAVSDIFEAVQEEESPHVSLLEAGTGVGKTLGYLAPSIVWAEKNKGAVWVSTYTKNLQRQIDSELDRQYPEESLKNAHVSVRKGRENYLCLLNYEDEAMGAGLHRDTRRAVAAGIMARWIVATKDGDLTGAQFPGWLTTLLGYSSTLGLSDRRGECIYAACPHYNRCFVEHSARNAERARVVIANHALVMIRSALADPDDALPSRYVFDEGHHLFEAADSAFAAHLTAQETRDLRRWILGAEGGRKTRARGLTKRVEDLCAGDADAQAILENILRYAHVLTADGWTGRLKRREPKGPCEAFLCALYKQVMIRSGKQNTSYSLETELFPLVDGMAEAAKKLEDGLKRLRKPMDDLSFLLLKKLQDDDGELHADTRKRLEAVAVSIKRRTRTLLTPWIAMLENLQAGVLAEEFTDWIEVSRYDGRSVDVGFYRHYIDPMQPFAATMKSHVHGMLVTSATLRDQSDESGWTYAQRRSGSSFLTGDVRHKAIASPFDYAQQTRVYVLDDVNKADLRQVSSAYASLFKASGGRGLGLFTAIQRLQAVYPLLDKALSAEDIALFSQHVDDIDIGTLIDMFKSDERACLLGTDAVRDGVDVPGRALELIVFDRVPWPRPTILHKARRQMFGGRRYDEMLTRLKLKQAFGRLIRRKTDKGVFVLLDRGFPSRLHDAFPEGVDVRKQGLQQTVVDIRDFLKEPDEDNQHIKFVNSGEVMYSS